MYAREGRPRLQDPKGGVMFADGRKTEKRRQDQVLASKPGAAQAFRKESAKKEATGRLRTLYARC